MSFLTDPILDQPLGYGLYIQHRGRIEELAILWYTESRGHAPADPDVAHGLWRAIAEYQRWGTLRRAFADTWPIAGQEPAPIPPPPPTPPPVIDVDPRTTDLTRLARSLGEASRWWPAARDGDAVAAHRVTRDIVRGLASQDRRWGLITKQGNQQGCTWNACGRDSVPEPKYGEDVAAFCPDGNLDVWVGFDCIGGAGAPGARLQWDGPLPIRAGNRWAPLPQEGS